MTYTVPLPSGGTLHMLPPGNSEGAESEWQNLRSRESGHHHGLQADKLPSLGDVKAARARRYRKTGCSKPNG